MVPKKPSGQATQAEVSLVPSLKNCLSNLPSNLVTVLVNTNTVAQNVVVELTWRQPNLTGTTNGQGPTQRSVYLGWTGMQSRRKLAPVVGRDGLSNRNANREHDVAVVEIDAAFGRILGLLEGQKVGILLHADPPQSSMINIEPLTAADWEMIELHAQFLELNFLHQIRALPNPSYNSSENSRQASHPITLHLSPTSTANVFVTALTPTPPEHSPFVKISPDAEVIVAPKTRQKLDKLSSRENRSVTSTSKRSVGGKSSTSTVRRKSGRDEGLNRAALFLRGVDRAVGGEWFQDEEEQDRGDFRIWLDKDVLLARSFRGTHWASVSVVKPAGLQEPVDPQKEQESVKPAHRVVAHISTWENSPDSQHVALSTSLCASLGCRGFVGGLVKVEPAPPQLSKPVKGHAHFDGNVTVKSLTLMPLAGESSSRDLGFKFGGESKRDREEGARRIREMYGSNLLTGPLTDGMFLPVLENPVSGWYGAILQFEPQQASPLEAQRFPPVWLLASEKKLPIEVQPEVFVSSSNLTHWSPGEPLPAQAPHLIGVDSIFEQLVSYLSYSSSVLLTGGLGSGKTCMAYLLAECLKSQFLSNVIYFPCRSLVTDETRTSTVKETLSRMFASAAWGARLGGRAIIILDDLDRLCPAETELQVGGENGRSRHISECICAIVRQYCFMDSSVVLLATAQSKEALNNVIIGGHVVREIVSLKAPNKEGRRRIMEKLANEDTERGKSAAVSCSSNTREVDSSDENEPSRNESADRAASGFVVDRTIDFLDLASQTDGYMPGDLVLLIARARSESLIRTVRETSPHNNNADNVKLKLTKDDFTRALSGFTPASLRNVSLQTSTTRWDQIGGLVSTRQTLLETLQYPTTYAPIFASCPLRLRSGLLLYGFPGCGKTLLASAVAGECGLNFISVKGPEILNKYIGASEKSVRDLFERAEAARPCVLFFDEFDSIAPKRGHDSTGVTDRVVNQLLTQMDGAEGLSGVYVLAATSRPDLIDPALLRPGRLDKSLICDMPNLEERIDILRAVTRKLRLEPALLGADDSGQNLREIAARTEGYSGADLQAVAYNAQLEAIHDALGDDDAFTVGAVSAKRSANGKPATRDDRNKALPDFTHFRHGDNLHSQAAADRSHPALSAWLAERAQIATKLANLQALRRAQKRLARQGRDGGGALEDDGEEDKGDQRGEPVIEWSHVERSLRTTRSSISEAERRRLAKIYREFIVGRSGEMPSGQGSSEIGGRTSLM